MRHAVDRFRELWRSFSQSSRAGGQGLAGTEIIGIRVVGHTLPVNYAELGTLIARLIEEVQPRAVICLGLSPGTALPGSGRNTWSRSSAS